MKTLGLKLDDEVRSNIGAAAVIVADITYPNANVFYEMGFAIGLGKPVIPTVNIAVEKAIQRVNPLGLFDTIGWSRYTNSDELLAALQDPPETAWTSTYARRKNHGQPLFVLDTEAKTDFRNSIFEALENSHVQFRTFDPTEVPRLTAAHAIAEVSSSAGVILPLIDYELVDAERSNLRASFLLGLCHGFDVEHLAIQYNHSPAPLDYREFITNSTHGWETKQHVSRFAAQVLIWNQRSSPLNRQLSLNLLSSIDLGSATAENETQRLSEYFVRTAAFARALRAEGAVVTGRKGSGKSAVYLQIVTELERDRRTCIVDLRPSSHNLSEMRETILSVVSAGVFDHTIAAFWQYTMYMEILLKLREITLSRARNDFSLQQRIQKVETEFAMSDSLVAGDFTSRLISAVDRVIQEMGRSRNNDDVRRRITNTMFETVIPKLRDAIATFIDQADEVIILIDDLDKGWPPRRVESHDISMVKHLIEGLNRIQRDLSRRKVSMRHLVFLRSDIYERLVEQTSDRGKYNTIKVGWSDSQQLRHLIRERVFSAVDQDRRGEAWQAVNPIFPNGDALSIIIEHSLRRPRLLIDLCERTISCAMNRGHALVDMEDVTEGLRQMSLYLVSDFAYEMRDVAGTPEDILYAFLGTSSILTEADIVEILQAREIEIKPAEAIELLLWYGFLGFFGNSTKAVYIYEVEYDFRRLEAERTRLGDNVLYVVNPAFLKGLERVS